MQRSNDAKAVHWSRSDIFDSELEEINPLNLEENRIFCVYCKVWHSSLNFIIYFIYCYQRWIRQKYNIK